ncbi:competence protein ComEC [Sporobacter termitidis DSM 10068]|uniref:Competence protein ComEC n=1 Tax=Sporobacter termitidis DSM 10068 TaxID=1123282 RepID=A0A1M5TSM8_9FIRM|nr:DNA internalization-related competence protein ComEC/Rec2 [Sporobacter termitidis]SHH53699.1 competence protein ComEC [Sporobacter termitidis DSM 10068]
MRKLATAAVSFSGALFMAHYLLPDHALLISAAVCAVLSLAGLLFRSDTRLRIFLVCLGLAAGFLWTDAYTALFFAPAKALNGKTESVTAVVTGYPGETDYGSKVTVSVRVPGRPSLKTQLYVYDAAPDLTPGNTIEFTGKFRLADTVYGENTDTFLSKGVFLSASLKGDITVTGAGASPRYIPAVLAHAVTEKLKEIFPADVSGFMRALIIGDTSGLSQDTALSGALSTTGTAHIIAVSGMNVAFLMGVLGVLIKNKRLLAAVGIPVVFLFMAVVGFMAPVTRAGIMQLFLLAAPLLKRETDGVTSLSASLLIILLFNPFAVGSAGLQLSFSATLGILLLTGKLYDWLERPLRDRKIYGHPLFRKPVRFVLGTLATTAGALVFSLPLIALHFGTVSLIAPLSNIAVLWAVELTFIGGIVAVAAAFLFAPAGAAAAFIVALPARFIVNAIIGLGRVPFAAVFTSNPAIAAWLVTAYLMLVVFVMLRARARQLLLPACLSLATLCLVLILTASFSDRRGLSVTALDVGQGQCIVVTSGSYTEVVDCGSTSGKDAGDILTKYLQSHGRTTIDLLVLTHYHEDHAGGVQEVLERNKVAALAVPDPSIDTGALPGEILELAADKGVRILTVTQDTRVNCGGETVTLYAPIGGSDENERGLAILCSEGGFDALITGDMSAGIERRLVAAERLPDIEVLIAGHHGSKTSTSDTLLSAVTPEVALISVGYNSYGHPAPETLQKLALAGIATYRTDRDGTVTVNAP